MIAQGGFGAWETIYNQKGTRVSIQFKQSNTSCETYVNNKFENDRLVENLTELINHQNTSEEDKKIAEAQIDKIKRKKEGLAVPANRKNKYQFIVQGVLQPGKVQVKVVIGYKTCQGYNTTSVVPIDIGATDGQLNIILNGIDYQISGDISERNVKVEL